MNNCSDYRFTLERYRSGGSNRYVCPGCGQKKCFTRYVDAETGEYVDDDCGKCDHEASCGYHYPPKDFFRDHPERRIRGDTATELIQGRPVLGLTKGRFFTGNGGGNRPRDASDGMGHPTGTHERHQTVFFDIAWAERAMQRQSTFTQWMQRVVQDEDSVGRVLADYYVGGSAKDIVIDGINYGRAVVFWLIDEQGRVHDGKLMAYTCKGHRVGNWGNWVRSICERSHKGPQMAETEKVLFGLHLLPRYPDKTVCIVESEKTALICACHYPQFLWLATGGCGNLQREKLRALTDRNVVVYPDSGEYDRWKECMAKSGVARYNVVDFIEQYEPNTDIADILLGEAKCRGDSLLPPPVEGCPF